MLPFCAEEGVGVIPYNPIAGGLLSGKHNRSAPRRRAPASRSAPPGRCTRTATGTSGMFDTVEQLRKLADEAGVNIVTLSVAWVLANKAITAPIIGASSPKQLDATLAAATYALDAGPEAAPRRAHLRVPHGRRPSVGRSLVPGSLRSCLLLLSRAGVIPLPSRVPWPAPMQTAGAAGHARA